MADVQRMAYGVWALDAATYQPVALYGEHEQPLDAALHLNALKGVILLPLVVSHGPAILDHYKETGR
jgi:hypothetical protein